jgi:hypothetical protein
MVQLRTACHVWFAGRHWRHRGPEARCHGLRRGCSHDGVVAALNSRKGNHQCPKKCCEITNNARMRHPSIETFAAQAAQCGDCTGRERREQRLPSRAVTIRKFFVNAIRSENPTKEQLRVSEFGSHDCVAAPTFDKDNSPKASASSW